MSPYRRFLVLLGAWALFFLSSPGTLSGAGSGTFACVAMVLWSWASSRPGPRAFWIEWLAASIGLSALCWWSTYVWWGTLLAVALVPALYYAVAGVLLRRLSRIVPLALAAPVAWVALESLRTHIEPPFAFGWMRLGTWFHQTGPLAGSARVWGVGGISFAVAALAGGVAARKKDARSTLLALGPMILAIAFGWLSSAPATKFGPRVLLVQPAFEQQRKMFSGEPADLFRDSLALTASGLESARKASERPPDLVAWGETMFPYELGDDGLAAAFDHGVRPVPWARFQISAQDIRAMEGLERELVGRRVFGPQGILPGGTSFLVGAELQVVRAQDIRRANGIVLWDAGGKRAGVGGKQHLVPGGEQLAGLERVGWVRDAALTVAGYIPDLVAFDRTAVLPLVCRDGQVYRFGTSVCFDNTFEDPYTAPLRDGPLDFHLVLSNEAWYRESGEYDQMLAFSRLIAIETGRSVVRATNAGVSTVLDPNGEEVARLRVGGKDRMVGGTLLADVPVPIAGSAAALTPYTRFERAWLLLWVLAPLLIVGIARVRGYQHEQAV